MSTGITRFIYRKGAVTYRNWAACLLNKGAWPFVPHQLWTILARLGKHAWKLVKPLGKFAWKITKDSLKGLLKALGRTIYNLVRVVMGLAVLALLGWFGWEVYQNGFHPRAALMEMGKTLFEWVTLLWRAG